MRPARKPVQVTLTLMPGSEPWVLVRHSKGWFKLPGIASAAELLEGACAGWLGTRSRRTAGEATVRVPMSTWAELEASKGADARRSGRNGTPSMPRRSG